MLNPFGYKLGESITSRWDIQLSELEKDTVSTGANMYYRTSLVHPPYHSPESQQLILPLVADA